MLNARQYLISFLATISGHKAVVGGLQRMETSQKTLGTTTGKSSKSTQNFNDILNKAAKRALIVAPVWMMLRTIMMGFIRVIGDMVRAYVDLDEGLARIRTVMHGSKKDIEAQMIGIKRAILDVAVNSRVSIKDLAEAFYFLKTSAMTAEEAMGAFIPTVNAMVATGVGAKEMARAMAGSYHTMGKYMDEALTVTEKFTRIADVLTYTYATQDVQLDELIQSYTKLAPYLSGLSDSFTEIVTMLGFLNTRLLRGGRAGRLTGRAILQLTKNAEKLANVLGITFDPDQPIALLDTVRRISEEMGKFGKITAEQGQIIQEVFATRAGVVIRLLIEHFDELDEEMKEAITNADGFAKKMADIKMATITGQMQRMRNIFAVLLNDFVSGYYGARDLADALSMINDSLLSMQAPLKWTGERLGWLTYNLAVATTELERHVKIVKKGLGYKEELDKFKIYYKSLKQFLERKEEGDKQTIANAEKIKKLNEEEANLMKEAMELYKRGEDKKAEAVEERIKKTKKAIMELMPAEIQYQDMIRKKEELSAKARETSIGFLDEINQEIKHEVRLMKALGANSLDIAEYELERLASTELIADEREYELDLLKAQNKVIEERVKYEQGIIDIIEKAHINLLQIRGTEELGILRYKEQQLNADKSLIGEEEYLLRLLKLKVQSAIEFSKLKDKELQTATDLYRQYAKADAEEKKQIERMMDLVKMTPGELARAVRDPFDFAVIDRFWKYFTERQREAMGEALRREEGLDKFRSAEAWEARTRALEEYSKKYWEWIRKGAPKEEKPVEPIAVGEMEEKAFDFAQILGDITKDIFQNWIEEGSRAITKLKEEAFRQEWGLVEKRPGVWEKPGFENLEERRKIQKQLAGLGVTIDIKNIEIVLPKEAIDRYAEEAGERVKEKVKEAIPELKKRIDEALQEL